MIKNIVSQLLSYALAHQLVDPRDIVYLTNQYAELFHSEIECVETHLEPVEFPEIILEQAFEYIKKNNLEAYFGETKDSAWMKIMNVMVPFPSVIENRFKELEKTEGVAKALSYFYQLSVATNYIKMRDILKNIAWKTPSVYGALEVTINLSKPEKDPKEIAQALSAKSSSYPQCLLCVENEGYKGSFTKPARQNHRMIEMELEGNRWFFQYSPYVYYPEHSILLNHAHTPMVIDPLCFQKLFAFVDRVPHYMIGSNADLPIVGGSILSHEHFQAGNHEFPMFKAKVYRTFSMSDSPSLKIELLQWPLSVVKLVGSREECLRVGSQILDQWRNYNDDSCGIASYTETLPHNTITPIVRSIGKGCYEFYLVLRNNRQSDENPLGIFHPHAEHHHIKKENIGLIEVMGLAILPGRLATEMELMKEYLLGNREGIQEKLTPHLTWLDSLTLPSTQGDILSFLREEIGKKFLLVLEDCGVFKQTTQGLERFEAFILSLGAKRR